MTGSLIDDQYVVLSLYIYNHRVNKRLLAYGISKEQINQINTTRKHDIEEKIV